MKRFCLSVAGMFLMLFGAFAQTTPKDSAAYKSRKLTFEEANLVSSYYHQDGNNSAVTGGVGTEKLTDLSNAIDVKFVKYGKNDIKHSFDLELGFDHYTSASSDKVNPNTVSSASHADSRLFPSLNWSAENAAKGRTIGAGASFSSEYDYQSIGFNLSFSQKTKNRNGEFTAKVQAYMDQVSLIYPFELRTPQQQQQGDGEGENHYASTARNSYSGSLSYSQIVNQRLQLSLIAEYIHQQGYLGLPFHRVYFTTGALPKVESLPDTRTKIPIGIRANYFIGDKVVLRSFYRYYHDDWGITAHTVQLETAIKFTPFFSVTPFYRYYTQSAVDYFAPYKAHLASEQFYTSNYDLSKFNSNFYGAGFRMSPPKGVFGNKHINMLELRYGHYTKTTGMNANIVSLNFKFK